MKAIVRRTYGPPDVMLACDGVFGVGRGAFAEYVCGDETSLALKPANVTCEQAAGVGMAGAAGRARGKIVIGVS